MLTVKQIKFCQEVVNGHNATEAYQRAFKSKSRTTCKVNGSKLLKQAEIKAKVKELQYVASSIANKATQKAIDKVKADEVMGVAERMSILSKIARGEIPLKKPMVCDGVIEEIEVVPDWMDRKNAIAELNKMDGSYQPTKIDATVTEKKLPSWLTDDSKRKP